MYIPQFIEKTILCFCRRKSSCNQGNKGDILTFQNFPTILQCTHRALTCANGGGGTCLFAKNQNISIILFYIYVFSNITCIRLNLSHHIPGGPKT